MSRASISDRNLIEANLRNCKFDKILFKIIDPDFVRVKVSNDNHGVSGLFITIIQKDLESLDIIDYFKESFSKQYHLQGKLIFVSYTQNIVRSSVVFFSRLNIFEKARIKKGKELRIEIDTLL